MLFMHIVPLVFLTVISFVIGCLITSIACSFKDKAIAIFFFLLFLFFLAWIIGSANIPSKIKIEEILPVVSVKQNEGGLTQMVYYKDSDGKMQALNANIYFGCQLPEGAKVRHIKYKTGPYCGVSYHGMNCAWEQKFFVEK